MERTEWTDERLDDAFAQLREEIRDMREEMRLRFADLRAEMRGDFADVRAEMCGDFAEHRSETRSIRAELFQLKLFMLGGLVTILAAVIALHG